MVTLLEPDSRETTGQGSEILDDVERFLARFVAYPSEHARIAHVLWIAHTHRMDLWDSTPRIAFLSPEPGSGKSRALEVTELLVPNPVHAVNTTPAYLFRKVGGDDGLPTILYDEIDTVFGPKAKDNEDIRGMLNAGHRKGSKCGRCVVRGKTVETEELDAYCAVALAGLDDLPDTLMSRSVVIRMRRRAPGEVVEPFRIRMNGADGEAILDRLAAWAPSIPADVWPELPDGIEDRPADVWEPLLAVADAAGGRWPDAARCAAVTLVTDLSGRPPSLGVQLLTDLKGIFAESGATAMSTVELLAALNAMELAPWANLRGQELDPRGLANFLKKYDVHSKTVRIGDGTSKGYSVDDLAESWARYVPDVTAPLVDSSRGNLTDLVGLSDPVPVPPHKSVTTVTPSRLSA